MKARFVKMFEEYLEEPMFITMEKDEIERVEGLSTSDNFEEAHDQVDACYRSIEDALSEDSKKILAIDTNSASGSYGSSGISQDIEEMIEKYFPGVTNVIFHHEKGEIVVKNKVDRIVKFKFKSYLFCAWTRFAEWNTPTIYIKAADFLLAMMVVDEEESLIEQFIVDYLPNIVKAGKSPIETAFEMFHQHRGKIHGTKFGL